MNWHAFARLSENRSACKTHCVCEPMCESLWREKILPPHRGSLHDFLPTLSQNLREPRPSVSIHRDFTVTYGSPDPGNAFFTTFSRMTRTENTTKEVRWDETRFGVKQWRAACVIKYRVVGTTARMARHCFTPNRVSSHLISLHFTSLHFTSLHFTSLHFISLHLTSLHFLYGSLRFLYGSLP